MAQLVELQKHAEDFKKLDAELIFVFREEQKGVEGLEIIRERQKTQFTLALDLNKKSSHAYSSRRGTFDNFVIDKEGKVVKIIDGTLKKRATAEALLKTLKELEAKAEKS